MRRSRDSELDAFVVSTKSPGIARKIHDREQTRPPLTADQIVDISALTGTARTSYNDAQAARQASRSATLAQVGDVQSMVGPGSALIATIRDTETSDDSEPITVRFGVGSSINVGGAGGESSGGDGSIGIAA